MNSSEFSKKLKVDLEEHQKRIDKLWDEINRRRKKVGIIVLVAWAGFMGLVYYLS